MGSVTCLADYRTQKGAPELSPLPPAIDYGSMDTNDVCKRIKKALKERSGRSWSVTHGRGTAYGWITIEAPPARRVNTWYTSEEDIELLKNLLGSDKVYKQGVNIPSSCDYYKEYIDRAEGRKPATCGTPYWD